VSSLTLCLVVLLLGVAGASSQDYTIGPRDVLKVTVWGHDDLSKDYPVDTDGSVPFPLLGRVKAEGLTTKAFASLLTELLEKDYLVNPQVLVSVKEYQSQKVNVLGETDRPGVYYLSGETSLLEILTRAGFPKASGKELLLVRAERSGATKTARGNVILRLDLAKIEAGDATQNVRLQDEDTVIIPKGQAFFVLGEVKKTGAFALDKETTVLEAITLAEGFKESAAQTGVKLVRRNPDGSQDTMSLDLSGSVPKDGHVKVRNGDTVVVPKGNTFFVFGEVKKPGAYQLDKETNVLEGITIAGGFTEKAAPGRTRVIRNTPKGQQVINIDMNDIVKRGQRDKAILLMENDVVVVPESFF
jgi:polysaccharide export outer membrane protein